MGARLSDGSTARLSASIRQLLAILIAVGAEGATSEQLAEELWGDALPDKWRPSLRMSVTRLRKAIGQDSIAQADGRYRLDLRPERVDSWWLERLADDSDSPVLEADLKRALVGVPFAGVEARALVSWAADLARAHQSELIRRFCLSAEEMSASAAVELVRTSDHLDEGDAALIARTLAGTGFTGRAVGYLESVLEEFEKEFGFVPDELTSLLEELVVGEGPPDRAASKAHVESAKQKHARGTIPPALEHLLEHECHGREAEIEQLDGQRSSLLVGTSGSGKTRLLAQLASQAVERGDEVSYVGSTPRGAPYGPFVAAFGELRRLLVDDVEPTIRAADGEEVHRATEASRWVATLEHLEKVAADRVHWVLIDDVHAFDSASKRMVSYLARSRSRQSLVFVVSGRSEELDAEWKGMRTELSKLGFGEVNIAGLSPAALRDLIKSAFPNSSLSARRTLADALISRNAGLPAVARSLLDAIDPETMTLDERIGSFDPQQWSQPIDDLDAEVVAVAIAAAVIGVSFSIGELIELLDRPEDEVTDALEILWESKRIIDGLEPDQLQFSHALVREAFLSAAPRFRLAALHQRAAAITTDLHERARHLAAAVPAVDAADAAASLIESARGYMATSGSWHDALSRLRDAELLLEGDLDIDSQIMMATALDLSGMSGKATRKRAFDRAVAAEDWDLALRAALSGLPAAEKPDGDPDRIAMLIQIPAARLTPQHHFRLAEALTRLFALDGQPKGASEWSEETHRLARTANERARASIVRWSTMHHVIPGGHHFDEATFLAADSDQQVRMLQMSAITSVESGDYDAALVAHRAFTRMAADLGDPVRIWQGKLFDAMVAFDQGRWLSSRQLSQEAVSYGTKNGMPLALLCGIGQGFHAQWVAQTHGRLIADVDLGTTDYRASSIAGASQALVLQAAGRDGDAWLLAEPIVRAALERPGSQALVVLAKLAEVVAESGGQELGNQVSERLLTFSESNLVTGFGLANCGPIWRHLAHLAADHQQRAEWLENAVRVADTSGALAWRIVTRLELARHSNDPEVRQATEELAAGTDLEVLLQPATL